MDFQPDLQKASTFVKNRKPPRGSGASILICARVVPMDIDRWEPLYACATGYGDKQVKYYKAGM
jgi:hypothetical protein